MPKLNQVIAVLKGKKADLKSKLDRSYHLLQRDDQFSGLIRNYTPRDDEGESLPSEEKLPQTSVSEQITNVKTPFKALFDVVLTQERSNQKAKADIVVDENTILKDVPVTYLMFLEKQLVDVRTFFSKIPVVPTDRNYELNSATNRYETDAIKSTRSKKVPRNHTLAEATEHHPAQVQVYQEDVIVGDWANTYISTGITLAEKEALLTKVDKLREAVKVAREEANNLEVENQSADGVLNYLFG